MKMKKISLLGFILAALWIMSFNGVSATDHVLLLDKHISQGITCVDCHNVEKPTKPATTENCLACHGGDYTVLAKATNKLDPNPHYTHLGDMPCSDCHNSHKPSVNMCASCHNIDMKVP